MEDFRKLNLNQKEVQELEEKLILIYRFINQERMYEKFFFEGLNVNKSFKTSNELVNKLLEMKDPEEFLETCILELEELRTGEVHASFTDILDEQDFEYLHIKYGMKTYDDVDRLDIKGLLEFI